MTTWQPEEQLLTHLDDAVPQILQSQNADGRFGVAPWISTDQNVLLALAAAYTLTGSRHCGSAAVLDAIAAGGEALVSAQDNNGMWEFRKKDGSVWGPIRMPWVYSRWMRAYYHIGKDLPDAVRQRWERRLKLGFAGIYDELGIVDTEQISAAEVVAARRTAQASQAYRFVRIHNIPAHHAMGLAFAGLVFGQPAWSERAAAYLHAVAGAQSEHGWWEEHGGPVVAYNFVYAEALGVYLALTGDASVQPALERAAQYHAEFTYPDGSAVETVDGRNGYMPGVKLGNCGLATTRAGRGWLARQHKLFLEGGGTFDADYAAGMLLYGDGGPATPPIGARDRHDYRMGALARTMRRKPWFACLSAITTVAHRTVAPRRRRRCAGPPDTAPRGRRHTAGGLRYDRNGRVCPLQGQQIRHGVDKRRPDHPGVTHVPKLRIRVHRQGDQPRGFRVVPEAHRVNRGRPAALRLFPRFHRRQDIRVGNPHANKDEFGRQRLDL